LVEQADPAVCGAKLRGSESAKPEKDAFGGGVGSLERAAALS
jgi:hypothetical protein